jgi:hypothetical protein
MRKCLRRQNLRARLKCPNNDDANAGKGCHWRVSQAILMDAELANGMLCRGVGRVWLVNMGGRGKPRSQHDGVDQPRDPGDRATSATKVD